MISRRSVWGLWASGTAAATGSSGTPAFARAAELLIKAATSAPFEGRPMYAALRAIPIPDDVVARFFHAGSLLREHRGDGHIAALMIEGVGGLEAHVLFAAAALRFHAAWIAPCKRS